MTKSKSAEEMEMTPLQKVERLQGLQRAIEGCTRPVQGHTDPLSINDCWNWNRELLEELIEYFKTPASKSAKDILAKHFVGGLIGNGAKELVYAAMNEYSASVSSSLTSEIESMKAEAKDYQIAVDHWKEQTESLRSQLAEKDKEISNTAMEFAEWMASEKEEWDNYGDYKWARMVGVYYPEQEWSTTNELFTEYKQSKVK